MEWETSAYNWPFKVVCKVYERFLYISLTYVAVCISRVKASTLVVAQAMSVTIAVRSNRISPPIFIRKDIFAKIKKRKVNELEDKIL